MKQVCAKWFLKGSMILVLCSACGNQYRDYQQPQNSSRANFEDVQSPSPSKFSTTTEAPKTETPPSAPAEQAAVEPAPETIPATVAAETPKPSESAPAPREEPKPSIPVFVPAPAPVMPTPAAAPAPEVAPEPEPFKFEPPKLSLVSSLALLRMPEYRASFGMSQALYEKVAAYYNQNRQYFKNPDYVTIVDFSKRSNEKRLFILDLRKSRVIKLLTTHGTGSDPTNTGMAQSFSNTQDSLQSSLGFFLTLDTYTGSQGYSLRLRGLEASNSNAEKRGIVMHSAPYVNEDKSLAGRSWGCLVLDPKVAKSVIDHLQGGSLIYIGK